MQDLIALIDIQEYSSIHTPLELNIKYHCDENDPHSDPTLFWQLVKSLNYPIITLSDIPFTIQ